MLVNGTWGARIQSLHAVLKHIDCFFDLKAVTGFEPADKSFAGFCLTTWLHRHQK